ncbi:MAG: DUF3427 domain-containing protein [Spirochaetales bacterium]|nr:DUF3427 domain-containing protein [Spirochaetales bacterium]
MSLEKGIYELVVNKEVKEEISSLSTLKATTDKLDGDSSSILISKYVENVLRKILEDTNSVEDKVEIANEVISKLSDSFPDYGLNQLIIEKKGEALKEVRDTKVNTKELERPSSSISTSMLFTGDSQIKLVDELNKEIVSSDKIDMLVSFLRVSGIAMIRVALNEFAERGGKLRVICTTYMGATEPEAVREIANLPNAEVKISYDTKHTRLHAKAYMFHRNTGFDTAYIGSSNLSKKAITDGREWNVKITSHDQKDVFDRMNETFESYWNSDEFDEYKNDDYDKLSAAVASENKKGSSNPLVTYSFELRPYPFQEAILDKLDAERKLFGNTKNLVVAATGTGKTVISAFDYRRFRKENKDQHRLLFVAHREEILKQSLSCFRGVLKDPEFGALYTGNNNEIKEGQSLFATIQKLDSRDNITRFSPDYFDFIIVDEFHHACADSYQKLLTYFKPRILLGLTATPERMDGEDILKYFDGNHIAAEIRLPEAIERQLLVPFHYFGVRDSVDLDGLKWARGGYEKSELDNVYVFETEVARKRAALIINSIKRYVGNPAEVKCLGFCVSIKHAEFMASFFSSNGLKAVALSSNSNEQERNSARNLFQNGDINYIFTVDLYNEGVDIPEIDTVMFLRPTESLTVFLQQLGRGLRTSPDKEFLTVLDFIGQSNKKYRFEEKFKSLLKERNNGVYREMKDRSLSLPPGCHIEMEKEAMRIVLDNIESSLDKKNILIQKLIDFEKESGKSLTLDNFFSYNHMNPRDFYKKGSFVSLLSEGNVIKREKGSLDDDFDAALKRLTYCDSSRFMRFIIEMLESPERKAASKAEEMMLNMFLFTVFNKNEKGLTPYDVMETIRKDEFYRREFKALLSYKINHIDFVAQQMDGDIPLDVFCTYNRNQILAAFGDTSPSSWQAGVKWFPDENTDVLLVTLNKSDKLYTPSTMYKDYAISPEKFHWETQNKTSEDSSTGRRYISSSSRILLFVREAKDDLYGSAPYTFLGPVEYESHKGSRPMAIIWKMKYRIPARFIQELSRGLAI